MTGKTTNFMAEEFAVRARFDIEHLSAQSVYYRVMHDAELPAGIWRGGLPEVFPLNDELTPFTQSWQLLSFEMNQPGMDGDKWRSLYAWNRAFTNGQGFNNDADPHRDFVNMRDLTAPMPAWDKTRVCGGATIRGIEQPPYLIVDILDGFAPAPTWAELKLKPWLFFHAVNSTQAGITKFPQRGGLPVLVPLVGSGVARIPLSNLQKVPGIADPYALGYQPSPY
jgi:hypothetical protein